MRNYPLSPPYPPIPLYTLYIILYLLERYYAPVREGFVMFYGALMAIYAQKA